MLVFWFDTLSGYHGGGLMGWKMKNLDWDFFLKNMTPFNQILGCLGGLLARLGIWGGWGWSCVVEVLSQYCHLLISLWIYRCSMWQFWNYLCFQNNFTLMNYLLPMYFFLSNIFWPFLTLKHQKLVTFA